MIDSYLGPNELSNCAVLYEATSRRGLPESLLGIHALLSKSRNIWSAVGVLG